MTAEELQSGHLFLLDKPLDWTSFQAVNKLKYKLKREFKELPKKFKIGHAGTLDPRATGLLIVCTGKFTKKIPDIQDAPKEYWTEIKIGVQTESYDTEKPEILHQDYSQKIDEIYQDESNCFSFTVMMFGLGDEANFDEAREKMGIKPEMLGKLGATAKDLRKMVSFISSSVSSSANGQNVSAITF